ncbi:hypothetical protein PPGU19_027730 [Paraburkholderia sp. PGU19]|nr:hypothetical protein PPGU19_027730 [Paraburkholderia sp. PGU19]
MFSAVVVSEAGVCIDNAVRAVMFTVFIYAVKTVERDLRRGVFLESATRIGHPVAILTR